MTAFEKLNKAYPEMLQADLSHEQIAEIAKQKGYSDEVIAQVAKQYTQPTTDDDFAKLNKAYPEMLQANLSHEQIAEIAKQKGYSDELISRVASLYTAAPDASNTPPADEAVPIENLSTETTTLPTDLNSEAAQVSSVREAFGISDPNADSPVRELFNSTQTNPPENLDAVEVQPDASFEVDMPTAPELEGQPEISSDLEAPTKSVREMLGLPDPDNPSPVQQLFRTAELTPNSEPEYYEPEDIPLKEDLYNGGKWDDSEEDYFAPNPELKQDLHNGGEFNTPPNFFEAKTFMGKEEKWYESIIQDLLATNGDSEGLKDALLNAMLLETDTEEQIKEKQQQVENIYKNFELSRYIQNNRYNPTTIKDTASRVESFPTLKTLFNLTDEEATFWNAKWKEAAPALGEVVSQAFQNFAFGNKKDFNGVLALLYDLGFDTEMTRNAVQQIPEYVRKDKEINIRRGSTIGAEDMSGLMFGEMIGTALLAFLGAPASVVLGAAAVGGAFTGAAYSKGEGDSGAVVAANAALGGGLPLVMPYAGRAFKGSINAVTEFFNVNKLYKESIATATEGMSYQQVANAVDFIAKNDGVVSEAAFFDPKSASALSAGVFRTLGMFLPNLAQERNIVAANSNAMVKGINKALGELSNSQTLIHSLQTGQVDDAIVPHFMKRMQEAHTELSSSLAKQYKYLDNAARDIRTSEVNTIIDKLADYNKTIPITIFHDKAETQLAKVGMKIQELSKHGLAKGHLTLQDVRDFHTSLRHDFTWGSSIDNQIITTMEKQIGETLEDMVSKSIKYLDDLPADQITAATTQQRETLATYLRDLKKANLDYQDKITHFEKAWVREFVFAEPTRLDPALFQTLDKVLNNGNIKDIATLKYLYNLSSKPDEFKMMGERYLWNKFKGLVVGDPQTLNPSAQTTLRQVLNNKEMLDALEIPQATREGFRDVENALKLAKNLERFQQSIGLPVSGFFGRVGYIFSHFLDIVRTAVSVKIYHNKDLLELVKEARAMRKATDEAFKREASKLGIPAEEALTLDAKKAVQKARKSQKLKRSMSRSQATAGALIMSEESDIPEPPKPKEQ